MADSLPKRKAPPRKPSSNGATFRLFKASKTAESGVAFTVNFFLGRLPRPELAIAAFGVLDGMLRVMLGPLRNLTPAVQTLTRDPRDVGTIRRFAIHIAVIFCIVMSIFQFEAARLWALEGVMGLPTDMAAYISPALQLGVFLALAMTAAAFFKGVLLSSRKTGAIAVSSGARIVAVVAVGGTALLVPGANGAVIDMLALIAAFTAEAFVLGLRVFQLRRHLGPA